MTAPPDRHEAETSTEASAWSLVRPWFRAIGVALFIVACKYAVCLLMPEFSGPGTWLVLLPLSLLFIPPDARL